MSQDIPERTCRRCGCSDFDACLDPAGTPCHWVSPDLCSACLTPQEELLLAQGRGELLQWPALF